MSLPAPASRNELDPQLLERWLEVPAPLAAEIIAGELVTMTRPPPRHGVAQRRLGSILDPLGTDGPGGWIILPEPAIVFGAELFVPDLAGWRVERMPELPDAARIELVPDWVCEILSDSTQGYDRTQKMPTYARFGVAHAWLIDPIAHLLEVYRLSDGRWVQLGVWHEAATVRAEPFDQLELDLARLWSPFYRP